MVKRFRILSCDGGGIRGLLSAVWLSRLEKKLGTPLRDHFDLIAGTSTGSILACAVSLGIPADDIVQMYMTRSREVFPPFEARIWERVQRTFTDGLSAPRYDGKGLEKVLKEVFGKREFGELTVRPTLVVSYNAFDRQAIVFKNNREAYAHLPVWEVVRASCAAPVYFPAHVMTLNRAQIPLIDGGVVANNPTACAVAEAIRVVRERYGKGKYTLEDFVVASFGTGRASKQISIAEARSWGGLQWVLPVIDVIFDGVSGAVDYVAGQILPPNRYYRFQCRLESAYEALDNAAQENINSLISIAEAYLAAEGDKRLDDLAAVLCGGDVECESQYEQHEPHVEVVPKPKADFSKVGAGTGLKKRRVDGAKPKRKRSETAAALESGAPVHSEDVLENPAAAAILAKTPAARNAPIPTVIAPLSAAPIVELLAAPAEAVQAVASLAKAGLEKVGVLPTAEAPTAEAPAPLPPTHPRIAPPHFAPPAAAPEAAPYNSMQPSAAPAAVPTSPAAAKAPSAPPPRAGGDLIRLAFRRPKDKPDPSTRAA